MALKVTLKRAYDPPGRDDPPRVLVDRVWPRGVSRDRLHIVAWLKEIAPSTGLRTWFAHDPAKWEEFRRRYRAELIGKSALLEELARYARGGRLTLVFGARDPLRNQAAVIRDTLQRRRGRPGRGLHRGARRRSGVRHGPPRRARGRAG
jgi:uncharacterized protein YeaO (DUF488 family)